MRSPRSGLVAVVFTACSSTALTTGPTGTGGSSSGSGTASAASGSSSGTSAGATSTGGGGHCSLSAVSIYPLLDSYPEGIAVGNLLDGGPDLVVTAGASGTEDLYLFHDDGGGGFSQASFIGFDAGITAGATIVADVNGDGLGDLVTCGFETNVQVFLNQGEGRFSTAQTYPVVCFGLAAVDLGRSGHLDIAVAGGWANVLSDGGYFTQLTVLINDGGGCFPTSLVQPGYVDQDGVAASDLNGDGWPDLVTVGNNGSVGHLEVYFGDGDGGLAAPVEYAAPSYASALAIADFTGDGKPDVATSVLPYGNEPGVVLYRNLGAGVLSEGLVQASLCSPDAVAAGDFNGDGRTDLAVAGQDGLEIWLQVDGGLVAPLQVFDAGVYSAGYVVLSADLNGDGRPDLAITGGNQSTSWLTVILDVCP